MRFEMPEHQAITAVVQNYFLGTYHGDKAKLEHAFHPEVVISGILDGKAQSWPLAAFIQRVTETPTCAEKNESYDKKILLIDYEGDCAMVKAKVQVNGLTFVDYITLLKVAGRWVIRNKSFTVVKQVKF